MKRLLTAPTLAAMVLGVMALAGGALAASRGGSPITACVHKTGGGLYQARHCARRDGKLTWSATGPRGAAGAPGRTGGQGPQGEPGSARGFAFVEADGTLLGKGGSIDIAVHKVGTGEYCLKMSPDPGSTAAIVATIQGPDLTAALISVNTGVAGDCAPDGGRGVFTMNPAGAAADHSFVVAVMGTALLCRGRPDSVERAALGSSRVAPGEETRADPRRGLRRPGAGDAALRDAPGRGPASRCWTATTRSSSASPSSR